MSAKGPKNERVRRFEQAVQDLIGEGYSILDIDGLLAAAAKRAGVILEEVHPPIRSSAEDDVIVSSCGSSAIH